MEFLPPQWIPVFIFFARILDVSLGTLRIVFVSKGMRGKATVLGFVEILIWITVVAQVFQNLDNWLNYIAFAGGFASGTFIGMAIEDYLKVGIQIFRIITSKPVDPLIASLKERNLRFTVLDAEGGFGDVKIIFLVARRKMSPEIIPLIRAFDPKAFFSVEDVKHASLAAEGGVTNLGGSQSMAITRWLKLRK